MTVQSTRSVAEIAKRCAEEMVHYQNRQPSNPQPCYELFHYALVRKDQEAWAAIYSQYYGLVRSRLKNAPGNPDALVNQVFERFWRAISPQDFSNFPALGNLLSYLTRCAWTVGIDAIRRESKKRKRELVQGEMDRVLAAHRLSPSGEWVLDQIAAQQAYGHVLQNVRSPKEQLVLCATIEWNLKPREIARRWPKHFADAREVCRIKERIYRRLRRDKELKGLLGICERDGGEN